MLKNILSGIKKAWVVIGGMGFFFSSLAAMRDGLNIPFGATASYAIIYTIIIVFFILTIFSAMGACKQQRWGKVSLTILLLLLVLYCVLYLICVRTGAGMLWFLVVWSLLIFAIVSIPAVWMKNNIS